MKVLLTLPLLTSCSAIRLSGLGPGFASLSLAGAIVLFILFIIKPNQDAKNERKRKAAEEAKARKEAETAFIGLSPLPANGSLGEYQDHFAETELSAHVI